MAYIEKYRVAENIVDAIISPLFVGEPLRQLEADDISRTIKVMKITSTICVILFCTHLLIISRA
ncbi:cobalamin biosynthesis protein CobD/CbiB [Neobacillus niacini]|jgi:cobalamin biosynthesis protein CobD/CbiB|uniref:hypothetical protein n=1 Tax=Neobacillus niacini TaxID=86668 RepID=UPI00277F6075|nr:hypothetical protein [Neobacillus niacini]MDQ1003624.1 cobalamin biosynthesis protein CobD/CbiB [Neobacillus niacini]